MTRARTVRRKAQRERDKLVRQREHLARLEPGGSPDRPLEVASASLVDVTAISGGCIACDGPLRLDEHTAEIIEGARLRVAHVVCSRCGAERRIYFRLTSALPN